MTESAAFIFSDSAAALNFQTNLSKGAPMRLKMLAAFAAFPLAIGFAACGGGDGPDDPPITVPDGGTITTGDGGTPVVTPDGGLNSDAGFEQQDGGNEQRPPASIGWCRIVNEPSTVSIENGGTFTASAQVFAAGRTEGEFQENSGIKGQMGTGAPGTDVTGWI